MFNKKIEITNKFEFEKTLTKIIELLRDNAFSTQANHVRQILGSLIKEDKKEFLKKLNSKEMFGGSGAIWETCRFESKLDKHEFQLSIIKLTDLMKEIGIKNNRAFSIGKAFKKLI